MTNLPDLYYYSEDSPSGLRWKCNRYGGNRYNRVVAHKDSVAGSQHKTKKYWYVSNNGKHLRVHRVIWELFNGNVPENFIIDHIDGNISNNLISNLRCVSQATNVRNCIMSKNNTSGVTGVSIRGKDNPKYWVASWQQINGKQGIKMFSIKKLGYQKAFDLACTYRQQMIDSLNNEGAGYTDRHGKEI